MTLVRGLLVGGAGLLVWAAWRGRGAPPSRAEDVPDGRRRDWVELAGSPIWLATGVRYRACVDLPFGVGLLATDARVRRELEARGFRDVVIRRDEGCDLHLEATWSGAYGAQPRPSQVRRAWGFFVVAD